MRRTQNRVNIENAHSIKLTFHRHQTRLNEEASEDRTRCGLGWPEGRGAGGAPPRHGAGRAVHRQQGVHPGHAVLRLLLHLACEACVQDSGHDKPYLRPTLTGTSMCPRACTTARAAGDPTSTTPTPTSWWGGGGRSRRMTTTSPRWWK